MRTAHFNICSRYSKSLTAIILPALETAFTRPDCRGVTGDDMPMPDFCLALSSTCRAELMTAIVDSDTGLPTLHTPQSVCDIKV